MIPKIIHYCWFGKGLMPKSQKDYAISKTAGRIVWDERFWNKCTFESADFRNKCEYRKSYFDEDYR